jgi:iron(III) transport system permease protein
MSWGRGRIVAAFALLCVLSLLASAWWIVESDGRTRLLARNALLLAAGTCVVSLPPGALLALLAARTNMPGRRAAGLTLGAMLFVPLYVQAAAWDAGFGPLGWCSIALDAVNSPLLAGWRAAIWVHAAASIPWVALIVASGLRFVDSDLEEQALLDGSAGQVLWRVTLRSAAPSLAAAALWILVTTAGEMTVTDLYRVRTYCEEL